LLLAFILLDLLERDLEMNSIIIFTDGGSRGNPGEAAIGIFIRIKTMKFGKDRQENWVDTNNVAEYKA